MKSEKLAPNCPFCGSKITGEIFWGFPIDKKEWSSKFVEWKCRDCGKKWGRTDGFHE